jgi:hypothetical protein
VLLIGPGNGWDEQSRVRLQSDLKQLMGEPMEVDVRVVPEIPTEQSGKRPIIKLLSSFP